MRYFFISDVHGQYDMMIDALRAAGFDKEKDTLVNLGDSFDRGPDSRKVLEFLMSCPNRILLWGNHDSRLYEVVYQIDCFNTYDKSNGMFETLTSFMGSKNYTPFLFLRQLEEYQPATAKLLKQYFTELVYAAEWKDLIVTHAWLPLTDDGTVRGVTCVANKFDWTEAIWSNTERILKWGDPNVFPDKDMIVGHWHAWRIAKLRGDTSRFTLGRDGNIKRVDTSTYVYHAPRGTTVTFIDGMSNGAPYGASVNVIVREYDEAPILHNYTY